MMLRRTFMKDSNGKFTNDFGFHEILAYSRENIESKKFMTPILHS